jgi:hypothetical protein
MAPAKSKAALIASSMRWLRKVRLQLPSATSAMHMVAKDATAPMILLHSPRISSINPPSGPRAYQLKKEADHDHVEAGAVFIEQLPPDPEKRTCFVINDAPGDVRRRTTRIFNLIAVPLVYPVHEPDDVELGYSSDIKHETSAG